MVKPIVRTGRVSDISGQRPMGGRVFALWGTGRTKIERPGDSGGFVSRFGFSNFMEADISVKTLQFSQGLPSSDPRYGFDAQITLHARLVDPFEFADTHGEGGTLLDPIWPRIAAVIEEEAQDHSPDDLPLFRRRLGDLARNVASEPVCYGGVELNLLKVQVSLDEASKRALRLRDRLDLIAAGPRAILAEIMDGNEQARAALEYLNGEGARRAEEARRKLQIIAEQEEEFLKVMSGEQFDEWKKTQVLSIMDDLMNKPPADIEPTRLERRRISSAETQLRRAQPRLTRRPSDDDDETV